MDAKLYLMSSYIFLTDTSLELEPIQRAIIRAFEKEPNLNQIDWEVKKDDKQDLQILERLEAQNRLKIENFDSKSDFRQVINTYYQAYIEPSLLFLGNLDTYSELLQEGMLRLLEEPPKNLQIVLFASSKVNILETIKSRSTFITIPESVILANLNQDLLAKVAKKMPDIATTAKLLLSKKEFEIPVLTKVERDELDFWLWQLEYYFRQLFKQNPHEAVAETLTKVLESKKLNKQNLQKKLVLANLFC